MHGHLQSDFFAGRVHEIKQPQDENIDCGEEGDGVHGGRRFCRMS